MFCCVAGVVYKSPVLGLDGLQYITITFYPTGSEVFGNVSNTHTLPTPHVQIVLSEARSVNVMAVVLIQSE